MRPTLEAEVAALASIHDFAARMLVACGDGADHDDHPNTPVATAVRQLAHRALLHLVYGVESYADWELHEAFQKMRPHLDPQCHYCRVRFALYNAKHGDEERARAERIQTLLAP